LRYKTTFLQVSIGKRATHCVQFCHSGFPSAVKAVNLSFIHALTPAKRGAPSMALTLIFGLLFLCLAVVLYAVRRYKTHKQEMQRREHESLELLKAEMLKKQAPASPAKTAAPVQPMPPAPIPAATSMTAAAQLTAAQVLAQPGPGGAHVHYQQVEGAPATAVLADQAALLDPVDTFAQPSISPQSRPPAAHNLPLRELAIALYEARGYRRETALKEDAPVLCFLQHRTEPNRTYGFVALQSTDPVGRERVKGIARDLRTAGHKRMILYSSAGFAPEATELADTLRIRMYGPAEVMQLLTQLPPHVRSTVMERAKQRAAPGISAKTL
jgi:hypothetical protein